MAMNIGSSGDEDDVISAINTTPLVDVMLVLLIIFLITTPVAIQTVPVDLQVVNYMPHMHLRGKDMKYEVIYPDGRRETLLWVPKFNFNWQSTYWLKKPVMIPKGSKLIATAHFDNSTKNKYNPDPKKDVRWGDPTYDEMMIAWMDVMVDNPAKAPKPDAARAGRK